MKKSIFKKGFWTLLYRSLGAALVFFSTLFFARVLNVEEFGLFSLGLTAATIVSVLVRGGMDNVVLKQVAANLLDSKQVSSGYIYYPLIAVCTTGLFISIILWFSADMISVDLFNKPKLGEVLQLFCWVILPLSIVFILSEVNKALGRTEHAAFYQTVFPPTITLFIVALFWHVDRLSLNVLVYAVAIGYSATAIVLLFSIRVYIFSFSKTKVGFVCLVKQGMPMLLLSAGALVMSWSDTIILGFFSSSVEVGVYYAASRTVLVTTLVLVAVNAVTAPMYARLYKEGELKKLVELAQKSSMLMWLVIMLPTGVLFILPEWVMSWFGESYESGAPILVVLAVGQLVNVACGSVGCLLTMTGNEKVMRNIILVTAITNIFLNVSLVEEYGSIGVAYATAFSVIMWNIWAVLAVKKNLGFWVFRYYERN